MISVICPTLNEAAAISDCLSPLRGAEDLEILLVDAGSTDETVARARKACPDLRLVTGHRGRAVQMNAGAAEAEGDILWFLHADSHPPADAPARIRACLDDATILAGAFRLSIRGSGFSYRLIEGMVRFRSEWLGVAYGDQGYFLRRKTFEKAGGFPDVPVMEDLYLWRTLRRMGRVRVLPVPLPVSARRWERQGVWRTTFRNWKLVVLDWFGVPPERLAAIWKGKA